MLDSEAIKTLLRELPLAPGVYRYYNISNELIYVGKAKYLRKRVANYFIQRSKLDAKTRTMVRHIHRVEYTLVNSEYEALLLENNLIKQYQPKYNINLKDDKTYPYLCLTHEPFPRLIPIRRKDLLKGDYFGPYTSVRSLHSLIESLRKSFFIRTCSLQLTEKNIYSGKFKICLEYHLGNCKGPCEARQTALSYDENIVQVKEILKGRFQPVKKYFQEKMQDAASALQFEQAQFYKERLHSVLQLEQHSVIVHPDITNIEVYALARKDKRAAIGYFKVESGSIIQTKTVEIKSKLEESDSQLLIHTLFQIHDSGWEAPPEILINIDTERLNRFCKTTFPQRGDKKKLIDLAYKNALYALQRYETITPKESRTDRILKKIQSDFNLKDLPIHMECFDNSNIQGTSPVASMVCFKQGKPSKKDYRHFNIKTVEGPNDFASMYEIVTRRYKRVLEEQLPLPQLIVVDGGKGQLSSACNALMDLGLYGKVPIVGIAKRLEEIYFPGDSDPIYIDKKSESLRVIQQMRDEAHRFAITFHRKQRSKNTFSKSTLSSIEGVGPETIRRLLIHFKSVKKIKDSTLEQLSQAIGQSKAQLVFDYFHTRREE
ncbi:MAG: excinuclease ABC subunit UvrC [Cytophagaceae bacterium]|jgi:excinuclease ABC subunit C|nr:excinuclease ABC subunit UvrC [Cytophagaceae bacterium]